jgi:cell fate (sporulation/competence/biofilm development) regulator YmcA (YheA/YmcA/DUF963 family)
MLKDMLNQFQLMEECATCQSVNQVQAIVDQLQKYQKDPATLQRRLRMIEKRWNDKNELWSRKSAKRASANSLKQE